MLGMEFLNPNVAGNIPQLLVHDQEKFVPCVEKDTKKIILEKVPLHGGQLIEERARNTAWTFRDGINEFERLDHHEHADRHAKLTLYKVSLNSVENRDMYFQMNNKFCTIWYTVVPCL